MYHLRSLYWTYHNFVLGFGLWPWGTWDLSFPARARTSPPAFQGEAPSPGPPGKSQPTFLKLLWCCCFLDFFLLADPLFFRVITFCPLWNVTPKSSIMRSLFLFFFTWGDFNITHPLNTLISHVYTLARSLCLIALQAPQSPHSESICQLTFLSLAVAMSFNGRIIQPAP